MTTIYHSLYLLDITLIDQTQDLGNLVTRLFNCSRFALDCESIGLGRNHPISLMNFALEDGSIFLVDMQQVRLSNRLRQLLQDPDIKKVMFDCRADADCLWHRYGVDLNGIEDMQIMEYVIQHPDLSAAHILPSFFDVVSNYQCGLIGYTISGLKPNTRKKWAARPLKKYLLDCASLEISSFLRIRAKLARKLPRPTIQGTIHIWSKVYALSRVNNRLFSKKDPCQSHHFMKLGIFKALISGDIPCTGCGLNLDHSEYCRNELCQNTEKCIVCKQVKLEMDKKYAKQKNMECTWGIDQNGANNFGIEQNRANHFGKYGQKK